MWQWRAKRLSGLLYTIAYSLLQAGFIGGGGWAVFSLHLPIASSMVLLCEQVRGSSLF
jgi:hypothetical protein